MIQRPGNCPECGHFYPLYPSWYSTEKVVQKLSWVKEWDPELVQLLEESQSGLTIEHFDGDWWYHITKGGAVEAFPLAVLVAGISPAERVGRTWRQKK